PYRHIARAESVYRERGAWIALGPVNVGIGCRVSHNVHVGLGDGPGYHVKIGEIMGRAVQVDQFVSGGMGLARERPTQRAPAADDSDTHSFSSGGWKVGKLERSNVHKDRMSARIAIGRE